MRYILRIMYDYVVVYYCFGDASPIDREFNPIPSIATIRKYNGSIPIVVLHCENNEHLFSPYACVLNFSLHKFKHRGCTHQLTYKAIDVWDYLKSSPYKAVIACDCDILWHRDINEVYQGWRESKKHLMIQRNLNTGLFGFTRRAYKKYLRTWFAFCRLFDKTGKTDSIRELLRVNYNTEDVQDESVLSIVHRMIINDSIKRSIYKYPQEYCYSLAVPNIRDKYIVPCLKDVYSLHYMSIVLHYFSQYKFGNRWWWDRIGRTGFFMSIYEYYNICKEMLGSLFNKFINHFGVHHEQLLIKDVYREITYFGQYAFPRILNARLDNAKAM
jgi:hypothetical protein